MPVVFAHPVEFLDAIRKALGLNVDISGLTIRSSWDEIAIVEVKIPIQEDQATQLAEVLRRYTLVPIDPDGEVPAPTADTLTPAPFDPTP
jgi:hypothetical protein